MNLTIGKTQNTIILRSSKSSRNSDPQVQSINVAADPKQEAKNWFSFIQDYWLWILPLVAGLVGLGLLAASGASKRDQVISELKNTQKEVLQKFLIDKLDNELTQNEIYNLISRDHFSLSTLLEGGPDLDNYLEPDKRKNYSKDFQEHLESSITDAVRQSIISSAKEGF
jgi:hypothetical protein